MKYAHHNHSTAARGSAASAIAIDIMNISQCREEDGRCIVYFKDGTTRQIDTDISNLMCAFSPDLFVQVNSRHFINLEEVQSISSEIIVLKDGTCIHMSRSATTRMLGQISGMLTFL